MLIVLTPKNKREKKKWRAIQFHHQSAVHSLPLDVDLLWSHTVGRVAFSFENLDSKWASVHPRVGHHASETTGLAALLTIGLDWPNYFSILMNFSLNRGAVAHFLLSTCDLITKDCSELPLGPKPALAPTTFLLTHRTRADAYSSTEGLVSSCVKWLFLSPSLTTSPAPGRESQNCRLFSPYFPVLKRKLLWVGKNALYFYMMKDQRKAQREDWGSKSWLLWG